MHNTHTEKMGKQCASELPVQNLKRHIKERRRDSKFMGYKCFKRLAYTSSFRRSIVHNLKRPKHMLCCGPGGALSKTTLGNLQPSRHSWMQLPMGDPQAAQPTLRVQQDLEDHISLICQDILFCSAAVSII